MIELKHVTKSYPLGKAERRNALSDVSIVVREGEFVSVVGPSGSGKSTFLAIAGLLEYASEGKVIFQGQDVTDMKENERALLRADSIGFVFQFASLIPTLNVMENVLLPKTLQRKFRHEDIKRAEDLLIDVGLADKKDDLPHQLSEGQLRRVALARAMISDPPILMTDEPTGAIDQDNADMMMELFHKWHRQGKTIIMVTHDRKLASQTDRQIEIIKGELSAASLERKE